MSSELLDFIYFCVHKRNLHGYLSTLNLQVQITESLQRLSKVITFPEINYFMVAIRKKHLVNFICIPKGTANGSRPITKLLDMILSDQKIKINTFQSKFTPEENDSNSYIILIPEAHILSCLLCPTI